MRPTIWAKGACARCLLAPPSGRRRRPSCHNHYVITSHLRYSSAKPVSKDTGSNGPPRIHFAGFGNRGALFAHAIRAVQPPLPLTLLLPSNRRFQQFVDNGGQIEIIEDGVSTIAEGFDAEVMPTRNPFSVKLYPSTKHYRLRTYAMGSRQKFDIQAEKQLEGSVSDHPRTNIIDYGRRVRFGGDPATPGYGLDPTYKLLESDLLQNDKIFSNNRLLSQEEAKKQQDPIHYLVLLTKPQRVVDELLRLKDRLNENSTILFTQRGMGFLEDANKVFPNPISRPSYLPGLLYHSTYSAPGKEKDQPETRSDILQFLAKASIDSDNSISTCSFVFHHKADGKMLVSKAGIYPKGQETPKRRKAVEYLLNVLISAKKLGVDLLEPKELRHIRIRDAVVCSVVHSLSVKYNCLNGDVIKTEERIEYARKLLREAASVVQNWLPQPAYEYLERSLGHYITVHADQINDTMDSVANGKESPIAVRILDYFLFIIFLRGL
jgi:ketopantoate reductase